MADNNDKKKSINDYKFLKSIGEGAYGKVYLAEEKSSNKQVAIKALDKTHIVKHNKIKQVYRERDILNKLAKQPNIIKLECTFQDKLNLYFIFEYCEYGSLYTIINKCGKLDQKLCKFYSAEILLALQFIHKSNIIHRDLKPENIMINKDFHLKLIDFGESNFVKIDPTDDSQEEQPIKQQKGTFVGTVYYVSPEMLSENISSPSSDLWAFGCILYRMIFGKFPFIGTNDYLTFQIILGRQLVFPEDEEVDPNARDLIDKLLQADPLQRLGSGADGTELDFEHLKNHPYFEGIDFDNLISQPVPIDKKLLDIDEQAQDQDQIQESNSYLSKEIREDVKTVVYSGELLKKNQFFIKQNRLFLLTNDGKINYYKDSALYKGTIYLKDSTRVVKKSKDSFEIITPSRIYYLSEPKNAGNTTDIWIQKIEEAIAKLHQQ